VPDTCPGMNVLIASSGGLGATATAVCAEYYTGVLCTQCSEHAY